MTNASPTIAVGPIRLLNVPHAAAVAREVWDDDVYRLSDIPDGSVVLDVGAFYGEFGLICAVAKECRVVAVEPSIDNFEIAESNATLNGLAKKEVFFLNRAVADTSGKRIFLYRPDHPAGSLFGGREGVKGIPAWVFCLSMSRVVQKTCKLFGDGPIVVKLDIEGTEREIFDADLCWLNAVSIVTMEWHNYDGDHYATILHAHGFDVDVTGGGPRPRPPWDPSIGGGLLFARRP